MSSDPDRGEMRFGNRMTDLEALIWRLGEHDPAFLPTMTMVATLDGVLDRMAVRHRVDLVTRRIPRLRDKVVAGPLKMVPPRWEVDLEFDLAYHLQWVGPLGDGGPAQLMRQAQALAVEPFEAGRPPWQMVVVEGRAGRPDALLLRLHHAYTDGLGALTLAAHLFDLERRPPRPDQPPPGPDLGPDLEPPESSGPSLLGRWWADLGLEVERSAALFGRVVPWAVGTLRDAALRPEQLSESALSLARSARDQTKVAVGPRSPILTGRSTQTHFEALEVPLAALRRAGQRAQGTVNDVFLAGLLAGLAKYHEKHGSGPTTLRVGIPISTRSDDSSLDMRNQLQGAVIGGSLRACDPIERIRSVHDLVSEARRRPLLGLAEDLAGLGLRLPGVPAVLGRTLRSLDMLASNVPGPPAVLYLAGARVERMVPFGPRSGAALNATLLSYNDSVEIGINTDPTAIPDPMVLLDCLRAGFDDVTA